MMVTTSCVTALILPLRQTRNQSTERLRNQRSGLDGAELTRDPAPLGRSWRPAHARH